MAQRNAVQTRIQERLTANAGFLAGQLAASANMRLLRRDGGWYAVVEIIDQISDEERALRLLDRASTLVHPGFFYDFHREGFVVLSLLPGEPRFQEGIRRLIDCFGL